MKYTVHQLVVVRAIVIKSEVVVLTAHLSIVLYTCQLSTITGGLDW